MLPPQNIFDNLSINEKTAIMAVLSRDRILREKEAERVMRLRIDLVRDKREGALIPGKFPIPVKRACARCREPLGLSIGERCPCCKHLICKKCRVNRNDARSFKAGSKSSYLPSPSPHQQTPPTNDGNQESNITTCKDKNKGNPFLSSSSSENDFSGINPFCGSANSSDDSYPKALNPFHSLGENPDEEIEEMKMLTNADNCAIVLRSSTPYTTRDRANSDYLNIPRSFKSTRRHSDVSCYSDLQTFSRTSSEISQLNVRTASEKDLRVSSEELSYIQIPSYDVRYARKPRRQEDHNAKLKRHLDEVRTARRQLFAHDSTVEVGKKSPISVYKRDVKLTIEPATPSSPKHVSINWSDLADSGGEPTLSDSSVYMTAYFSSSYENRHSFSVERCNFHQTLDRQKSSSTNDISSVGRGSKVESLISDFSEKEAIQYLLEMGRGLHQHTEGSKPPNGDKKEDEKRSSASHDMEQNAQRKTSKQKDSATENVKSKRKLSAIMSSALSSFGSIASEFKAPSNARKNRDETKLATDSINKRRSTFSVGFLDDHRAKVLNKIKDLVSDKKSKTPRDDCDNKRLRNENAAKLYQMAVTLEKIDSNTLKEDDDIETKTSYFDINTQTQLFQDSKYHLESPNQRRVHSNPNSPYRTPKLLLPVGAYKDECLSETSEITDEELVVRRRESSSSNPATTPSSDEYFFDARNKVQFSSRKLRGKPDLKKIIKDSGYSTHEKANSRQRSRRLRATRRSRRARDWERTLRRRVRKSAKKRGNRDEYVTAYISSPNLSEEDNNKSEAPLERKLEADEKIIDIVIQGEKENCESCGNSISPSTNILTENPKKHVNANVSLANLSTLSAESVTTDFQESKLNSSEVMPGTFNLSEVNNDRVSIQQRPLTNVLKWFENLGDKVRTKSFIIKAGQNPEWICRVCNKSLELKKKSGDWFHLAAKPEVKEFKEVLLESRRRYSGDGSTLFPTRSFATDGKPQNSIKTVKISPLVVADSPIKRSTIDPKSDIHSPVLSRARSRTLPTGVLQSQIEESFSRSSLLRQDTMDELHRSASLVRLRNRASRKSIAEVLHGTLLFHVPEPPEPIDERPKFVKKQTSLPEALSPARIEEGPDDLTILRGNPISLCCKLSGSPPLKTAWRKGKHEISHSSQCNIDITNHSASLTIVKSEKDDSGCYTLQVKNAAGVDQYSVNVSVVDVPDPPGQPFASDISASSLVLSWYGSGYDGGSLIKSYQMEMAEIDTKGKLTSQWSVIASTNSTSYTLKNLKPNTRRVFRISAENRYGVSKPGPQSDVVINTETEVVESSDEEDAENFVKHDAVLMRTDGSFSEKYEIKEKLGQGRFGKVHRVISRNTGKSYAAKIMRALKAKDKEAVQQEIDVMNSLRHPRLVQLIDAYTHGREITMVMDLVAGGELFERVIDEDFELTEAACIKYMRQICDGLKYMHDNMILHLDLKPENIMCINKTGTKIKIIDFGLARRYSHSETIRVMFGTPEFVAPEVINYDAIGPQTDMWSVGVICYILLSGLSPFMGDNDSETLSNITAVEWDFDDDSFDQISDEAKHFIRQLLVKPLGKRYTVSRALEHRWLKKDTEKMSKSKLNTKNLKRFLARRKWQKTGNAVRALGRLASLANLGSSNSNKTANGQQRESGFLAALKAQLLRDNEEEQLMQENCKPMFEQLFDDIEVIEGSAAKFECVIIGTPDPEIMWFKDGEPIKESRHYKISYTEDDICSLLITDATEADEAEYSCKAVNCEGEVEHRAELIVITPGA